MRVMSRVAGSALLAALFVVPGVADAQAATPARHHPAPVATAATAPGSSAAAQMLALVNTERGKAGCGPVRLDARLSAAATKHSQDMADHDYFSHVSQNGDTFVTRIQAEGYPRARSENIAAGSTTAAGTMDQWMTSPGHRTNILDCTAKDMGVGVGTSANSTFHTYWTQDFGLG